MLQEEDLIDMMHLLDSDGDGEVTKDEFKPFLMRVKQWTDESDFEREWKKIDLNGDNVLQLSELCDYYGVDTSAVVAGCEKRRDMTDEQVLEALQRQSELVAERMKIDALAAEERRKKSNNRTGNGARPGVKLVKIQGMDLREADEANEDQLSFDLLESLEMGEFKRFEALLANAGSTVNLRIEDEKGEMPIHKLARKGHDPLLRKVLERMDPETVLLDINAQDKSGNNPLFHAALPPPAHAAAGGASRAPPAREKDFAVIHSLLNFGADLTLTTNTGWTVLHHCAHHDAVESARQILHWAKVIKTQSDSQIKRFVTIVDRNDKRSALHIAAFRASPAMVRLLMERGADAYIKDGHGYTAAELAEKGRKIDVFQTMQAYQKQVRRGEAMRRKSVSVDSVLDFKPSVLDAV